MRRGRITQPIPVRGGEVLDVVGQQRVALAWAYAR